MKSGSTAMNPKTEARIKINRRDAYHQAGRAVAIYLGNRQKQLPDVYFQIIVKPNEYPTNQPRRFTRTFAKHTVQIEGGRLIQNLPLSFVDTTHDFSWPQQEAFLCAFEADVINLLAGSLAEAKYMAARDNENFKVNLLTIEALKFYGGHSDLEIINEYIESFILQQAERKRKLTELFLAAYGFVDNRTHWNTISALAEFILKEPKDILNCEEVIALLESRLAA